MHNKRVISSVGIFAGEQLSLTKRRSESSDGSSPYVKMSRRRERPPGRSSKETSSAVSLSRFPRDMCTPKWSRPHHIYPDEFHEITNIHRSEYRISSKSHRHNPWAHYPKRDPGEKSQIISRTAVNTTSLSAGSGIAGGTSGRETCVWVSYYTR